MKEEAQSLPWVTPAKYVGPAMVVILLVAIADLLGELIRLARRGARPPGA